jgi:hypothetical protein
MMVYKCDRCGCGCSEPVNWFHCDDPFALTTDLCFRCTEILVIKGLQSECVHGTTITVSRETYEKATRRHDEEKECVGK